MDFTFTLAIDPREHKLTDVIIYLAQECIKEEGFSFVLYETQWPGCSCLHARGTSCWSPASPRSLRSSVQMDWCQSRFLISERRHHWS